MKDRFTRLAPDGAPQVDSSSRLVNYVFSDESVGRDAFVVKWNAWQVENFEANPVFLWNHMDEEPPIGKIINLEVARQLRGAVRYAETEFATTIFELVRDRFLNAVSTSWLPIESEFSSKPGVSRVFTKVDLLEISQVGIGALPSALAARSHHHINLNPLRAWTERALDMRACRTVPRAQLEALHRAAGSPPGSRRRQADPADAGRRARAALVQEIIQRGERMERARRLAAGERAHFAGADRAKLKAAQRHLGRAAKHHESVSLRHGENHGHIEDLKKIHERATSTLADFGERSASSKMARHLDALDRCVRTMSETHEDQTDCMDNLGVSIEQAGECVDEVLDQDEPAGVADK